MSKLVACAYAPAGTWRRSPCSGPAWVTAKAPPSGPRVVSPALVGAPVTSVPLEENPGVEPPTAPAGAAAVEDAGLPEPPASEVTTPTTMPASTTTAESSTGTNHGRRRPLRGGRCGPGARPGGGGGGASGRGWGAAGGVNANRPLTWLA